MLTLIAMLMKLLIGSVTSYILTTTIIKKGKIENYFKISFIGILSTSIFSVSYQLDSGGPYMFSAGSLIFLGLICNIFIVRELYNTPWLGGASHPQTPPMVPRARLLKFRAASEIPSSLKNLRISKFSDFSKFRSCLEFEKLRPWRHQGDGSRGGEAPQF